MSSHPLLVLPLILLFSLSHALPCSTYFRPLSPSCHPLPRVAPTPSSLPRLPSPRFISNHLFKHDSPPASSANLSHLSVIFGQFLDHSLIHTATTSVALPIPIPPHDPLNVTLLPNFRVSPINLLPPGVDLSAVYGPSSSRLQRMRRFKSGHLLLDTHDMLPLNRHHLANMPTTAKRFLVSGDVRANENPVLAALHVIWAREHNKICKELKGLGWDDEKTFWEARRINVGMFQKVVFEEWLPIMIGSELSRYTGWRRGKSGEIDREFGAATFRIGHSMVRESMSRRDKRGRGKNWRLREVFWKGANSLRGNGVQEWLRGAVQDKADEVDLAVTETLRNFLFRNVKGVRGLDLVSLNLMRCRELGCKSFKQVWESVWKRKLTWREFPEEGGVRNKLQRVYGQVWKVELFVGLLAEKPCCGGALGRTSRVLWKREFEKIRDTDKWYWRRHDYFGEEVKKLERVQKMLNGQRRFGDVLRESGGLELSGDGFRVVE